VPFHALAQFHAVVAEQMPQPYPGLWSAWREILMGRGLPLQTPMSIYLQENLPSAG
jgi:hypothetical protein